MARERSRISANAHHDADGESFAAVMQEPAATGRNTPAPAAANKTARCHHGEVAIDS
jgi:hypothetical protein